MGVSADQDVTVAGLQSFRLTLRWFEPDICPFCLLGKAAPIKTTLSAAMQRLKALPTLFSRHIAHLGMSAPSRRRNAAHSEARPVPSRQNSRFWMFATSQTANVRGVPNGGSVRLAISDATPRSVSLLSARDSAKRGRAWILPAELFVCGSLSCTSRLTLPGLAVGVVPDAQPAACTRPRSRRSGS